MVRKGKGSSLVRDKTTYEMARRLAAMRAEGMTKQQMMAAAWLSRSTVNNRLRVWDRLNRSPRVLREFEEGRLSTMEAERLAKHTDPSNLERELRVGRPRYRRLSVPEIRRLLKSCTATLNRSDEWKQGAIAALRCVLEEEQIPDVWPRS